MARDHPCVPPEPGASQEVPGDTSPDAGGMCERDTHPEAGQAGELAVERGEAVVTHREMFLQGRPREAPVSRERSRGCAGQWSGPHTDSGVPQSQESWDQLSPDPQEAAGTPPVSNWLIGPSVPMLPPHPPFLGADLAETPQCCSRIQGALGCYQAGSWQSI